MGVTEVSLAIPGGWPVRGLLAIMTCLECPHAGEPTTRTNTHTSYSYTRVVTTRSNRVPTFRSLGQQASEGNRHLLATSYPTHRTTHLSRNMRLSGAGVKRFCNPVKLTFTEWGNWEPVILEAVGKRKALLMTVRGAREFTRHLGMCSTPLTNLFTRMSNT